MTALLPYLLKKPGAAAKGGMIRQYCHMNALKRGVRSAGVHAVFFATMLPFVIVICILSRCIEKQPYVW